VVKHAKERFLTKEGYEELLAQARATSII